MFAHIKQNYEIIEKKLGCLSHKEFGRPPYYGLFEETLDSPNLSFKLSQSSLLREAAKGDVVSFNSRLADGVDVNASKNFIADIEETIGAMLDYKNTVFVPSDNLTPLHFAAINGHFQVVELLISKGADVNAADDSGLTPLHLACGGGYIDVVKLLSDNGANVNAKDKNDVTPLHFAAAGNHQSLVPFLVSKGSCVKMKTKSFKCSERVGENCIDHHIGNWTPFEFTIEYEHFDTMKVLLPIEVSEKTDYVNKLHIANKRTFIEAWNVLISVDEHVMQLGTTNYELLFELAIDKKYPEAVKALVKKNINVDCKYEDGSTPLFRSIVFKCNHDDDMIGWSDREDMEVSLDIIRTLLINGADVNLVNSNGLTPLDLTVMKDPFDRWGLMHPLLYSMFEQNTEYVDTVIDLLLENGCSRESILKSINRVEIDGKNSIMSLKRIVKYYVANYPGEKPEYLQSTWDELDELDELVELVELDSSVISKYWDTCLDEVSKMKKISFGYGVVLYNVFRQRDFNTIALYTKNNNIMKYCESVDFKTTFPIYNDFIVNKLRLRKKRAELLDKLYKITIYIEDIILNSACQLNIVKYLSDNDLYNLIRAAVYEPSTLSCTN